MFALLVQLALHHLLGVQHPVLVSLAELENDGLVQPALTVLLARIKVLQVTCSQHVVTALLELMAILQVYKLMLVQALALLAHTLLLELLPYALI